MQSYPNKQLNTRDHIFQNDNPLEQFELREKIGQGNYGKIYKGILKQSGQLVAIKILPLTDDTTNLIKEINIIKECQNDHIVKYYGSYMHNDEIWLIMEYCQNGSILDLMSKQKTTLKQQF